jgi:addiction module RelB/DinJ family antitoxin
MSQQVVSAPKTDMYRMRINPDIRQNLEEIYARNGLTLTDAINVFFQQTLNVGGLPFAVSDDNAEVMRAKATARLVKELEKGDACTTRYDAADARRLLGIDE